MRLLLPAFVALIGGCFRLALLIASSISLMCASAEAQTSSVQKSDRLSPPRAADTARPKGCPLTDAMRVLDEFALGQINDYAGAAQPLLKEMNAIVGTATKEGVSVGQQLSLKQIARFNDIKQRLVLIQSEKLTLGHFIRDAHLAAELAQIAKISNLYDVGEKEVTKDDPRRFFLVILQALRMATPNISRSQRGNISSGCDLDAGLYFEQEFNQQQLAKAADKRVLNLALDIERIRLLYRMSWNLYQKGIEDIRATKWDGDEPKTPNNVKAYIALAGVSIQTIYKEIIPFIDANFPSEQDFEIRFLTKEKERAEREFPAVRP